MSSYYLYVICYFVLPSFITTSANEIELKQDNKIIRRGLKFAWNFIASSFHKTKKNTCEWLNNKQKNKQTNKP